MFKTFVLLLLLASGAAARLSMPLDKMEVPSADPDQCGNFCDPQFGPGCGPGACANCREAGLDAQGAIAYACQN